MKKSFLLIFLFSLNLLAQQFDIFPGKLNVQPFTANSLEPRVGFLFQLSKNELRLDVGNSIDIFHYKINEQETFSFGADFFTYTLLRGESNFHFPVDAVDYLFGINGSYKFKDKENEYGTRLRISHISAHFVDGHYDGVNKQWRDGLNPRVYSREFIELITFYKINSFRTYGGITYLLHSNPDFVGKINFQIGFDFFLKDIISGKIAPFVAYDFKSIKLSEYSANHSISAGLKFGKPFQKGLSLYFNFYSGKSIHGEYFDLNKKYVALGINLDL